MNHPPGSVIVPCHDLARYHHFTHDLMLLEVPDDSTVLFNRSASITQNLNQATETFMEGNGEWIWQIGDDHTFPRDVVMRLLDHEVDIVAPLCVRRGPPFTLVAFDYEADFNDELGRQMYHALEFEDLPEHGLLEVVAAGGAGMLIRRNVLEAIGYPWFSNSDGVTTDEDMEFCRRAREAGFTIWLDVDLAIGHLGIVNAVPTQKAGVWGLTLDLQGAGAAQFFVPNGLKPQNGKQNVAQGVADVV